MQQKLTLHFSLLFLLSTKRKIRQHMNLKVPNKVKRYAIKHFDQHLDENLLWQHTRPEAQNKSSMTEDMDHRRHEKYFKYSLFKAEKTSRY